MSKISTMIRSVFFTILTVVFLTGFLLSCSKESDCWKCRMTFPIGGPDKDTTVCQDAQPNFEPRDANGNAGGLSCSK